MFHEEEEGIALLEYPRLDQTRASRTKSGGETDVIGWRPRT